MKLNKKGFAFSTMLYGSVAIITAVLYIILNINKSSLDTTYYYGEEILKDLNYCINEEIALENCYSSGSSNCSTAAYHACLGVSDNNTPEKGIIISEKLKTNNIVTTGDGLYEDPFVVKRYVYVGTNVNNYLEYSGRIWRIVSIEPSGVLTLIDVNKYVNAEWDNQTKSDWKTSSLLSGLNSNYLSAIADTSKIISYKWIQPYIFPSLSASDLNLTELVAQEMKPEYELNDGAIKVGILSVSDYIKATTNSNCKTDVLGSTACNSWLVQYKGWTVDIDGETGSENNGYAYYMGTNNQISLAKTNTKHDVYPIIYLDRNSIYSGGTGTSGDPYVLK